MGWRVCSHETPEDARRCECTGYGFGDLPCRCGHLKSQHENGTGRCVIPAARCHEFVLRFDEPFPVTVALVGTAAAAIMAETGAGPEAARDAAMAALFAGRKHALERDHVIERTRAENHRLRQLLDQAEAEIKCLKESAPGVSA